MSSESVWPSDYMHREQAECTSYRSSFTGKDKVCWQIYRQMGKPETIWAGEGQSRSTKLSCVSKPNQITASTAAPTKKPINLQSQQKETV